MTDPAPFRSVEGALKFAYRMEGQAIVKVSSYFSQMRGSTVRGKSRSDGPWDDHAQAAMILALADRSLDLRQMACIRAYYTVPTTKFLDERKIGDYRLMAELVRGGPYPNIDHWYAVDVVRGWAKDRRHHTDAWWARHLNVSEAALNYYRCGRPKRGQAGITEMLDALRNSAEGALNIPMTDGGLVAI